MTDREAMEQALEALAAADDFLFTYHDCEPNNEREIDAYSLILARNHSVFNALRERLAQPEPEQEPVAWMWRDGTVTSDPDRADGTWTPLYTTPPQRKPLTDEECDDLWAAQLFDITDRSSARDFIRDVEAAHGIKGEA